MTKFLPKRLSTQLVLTAVVVLILAQAVAFPLFFYTPLYISASSIQNWVLQRTASIAQVLVKSPPEVHELVLEGIRSRPFIVEMRPSATALVVPKGLNTAPELANELVDLSNGSIQVATVYVHPLPAANRPVMALTADMTDGRQIYVQMHIPDPGGAVALLALGTAIVLAIVLSIVMFVMLRRLTRPLMALATAAEALGRSDHETLVDESGPLEIQETMRAFNRMQVRITNHINQRTKMLAAVSHDLRTPITALRLQAEFVDDLAQRERMLGTLKEMESVTEAALEYLGDTQAIEKVQAIDLAALIDTIAEELRLIGHDISYDYEKRVILDCRVNMLKRALSNLIQNAALYGEQASIHIEDQVDTVWVLIEDIGPGIPEAEMETALKPFSRLESSRNRSTGGSGLGLSIAADIIQLHQGELVLSNRNTGGLQQKVVLPRP